MELRRLTREDAEAFRQVRLHGLKEAPQAFSADYEASVALTAEYFATWLKNEVDNFVIGAFVAGQLVGIGGFRVEPGPKLRHKGMIWGVYVLPEHRSGGMGRKVIEEIVAQAAKVPDLRQINITVTAANERAKQLYVSMGFEPWGLERSALWIDGEFYDDVHMVKFVSKS